MGRLMRMVDDFGHFVLIPTQISSRPSVLVHSTSHTMIQKLVPLAPKHTLLARPNIATWMESIVGNQTLQVSSNDLK